MTLRNDSIDPRRWFCRRCAIVRDVESDTAPWCRHNALDLAAERMVAIPAYHPFARGPLPWGVSDPSLSAALPGTEASA